MAADIRWPKVPYKGLSYYGPDDVPLFAGRDDAIRRCARRLADPMTRVLILQGPTGCGKSSFLRAGLAPFLEDQRGRFEFARSKDRSQSEILFVRSYDTPLKYLAAEVFKFASTAEIQTEDGFEKLDYSAALLGCEDSSGFADKAGGSAELMIGALRAIAEQWPRTLLLIIDQGEEVLTLRSEKDPVGEEARNQFFDFLYRFNRADFDLKLIIAIRTEYYGKFVARMGRNMRDLSRVEIFYLSELTEPEIVEAIKRPTSQEEIKPYGRPSDHYPFTFAPRLPEKIASDVMSNQNIKGGVLPVVQIVCENLYSVASKRSGAETHFQITSEDYEGLPKIEVQFEEYLKQKLREFASSQKIQIFNMDQEVDRWKDVLSVLSTAQPDGTVVTQVRSEGELEELARKLPFKLPFVATMKYLSNPDVRILRGEEVINAQTRKPVWVYSLGHDAIGLMMEEWKTVQKERSRRLSQLRTFLLITGLLTGLALGVRLVLKGPRIDIVNVSLGIYFVYFLILGASPRFLVEFTAPYSKIWARFIRRWETKDRPEETTGA
jgi:hypothetical protein